MLHILFRVVGSLIALAILAKVNGAKQVAQMTWYDYIVGIAVGSLAGSISIDLDTPMVYGLTAIALYMLSGLGMSFLSRKSINVRRFFSSDPIFLIARGEIIYEELKRSKIDAALLLSELRSLGFFDINEIDYAILETKGTIAVKAKPHARNVKVSDLSIQTDGEGLLANVILDGKILYGNLEAYQKDEEWLLGQLKAQGIHSLKDVIIATLSDKGELSVHVKSPQKRTSKRVSLI